MRRNQPLLQWNRCWKISSGVTTYTSPLFGQLEINDILELSSSTALLSTEEGFKATAVDFGVDMRVLRDGGGLHRKRQLVRLITAWKQSKVQPEVKLTTDAREKVHGEPVIMLPEDWRGVMKSFTAESELPAQTYYE